MDNILEDKLKSVIKSNTIMLSDETEISDNTDLVVDLDFDSLSIIKLVTDIETEFNFEFEDKYLVSSIFSNYSKLRDCVEYHIKKS